MKHSLKITIILVVFFFLAQVVGLSIVNSYIDHKASADIGKATFKALPGGIERPQVEEETSYIPIFIAILIGTILVLIVMKLGKMSTIIWKLWFFLSVFLCLALAFGAFMGTLYAFVLSFILSIFKVFKPNIYVHNVTELFVYGGLAALLVPIMNLMSIFVLLFLISLYDMFAVWQSKHMVKMAKFQTKSKLFAGLSIPYALPKKGKKVKGKMVKIKTAVLGGGDIGFPLIFAGVVMKELMLIEPMIVAFFKTLIIPVVVSFALLYLLVKAEKDKFYPAMPFISIGCILGYGVLLLVNIL